MKRPSWFAPELPVIIDPGPERKVCAVCREDLEPLGQTMHTSYLHAVPAPQGRDAGWFQHNPVAINPIPPARPDR